MTDSQKVEKMPNYIEPLIGFARGIKKDAKEMKCLPLLGDKIDNNTVADEIAFGLRPKFLELKKSAGSTDIDKELKNTDEYKLYGIPVTIEYVDGKYVSKGNTGEKDVEIDMSMAEDRGNDAFFFAKEYMKLTDEQQANLTIYQIKSWWERGKIELSDEQVLGIIKTASKSKDNVNANNFQDVLTENININNITKESKNPYDTYWWAMTPEEKTKCLDREGIYGVAPNGQKITMREALKDGLLKEIVEGPYAGLPISCDTNGNYVFKGPSMARGQGRHYGCNKAADNLIITYDINTGQPLILSLTRTREKCDSMPGGMKDGKELNILTAIRETIEELELSGEKDVREFIQDALKQYEVNNSKITNAIYDYCTKTKYRVGGDMHASTDYDKFEQENKGIIKEIAKIKGFATGINYDQRDGMLTDHGTEVFPMILPPKFVKKLQAKLAKNGNKASEAIGYNLRPLDQYKDLRFANHATLIAQTIVPFAQIEYERVFKKCFPGDDSIKFDGENISFIGNKQPSLNFEMINKIRTRDPRNKESIKYTELFETSAFKTLYNEAVKDNLKTERMELFTVNNNKEITINEKIKSIYTPKIEINQQNKDNNPNKTKQFLRAKSALPLETRILDAKKTKELIENNKNKFEGTGTLRPSTAGNKANILQEQRAGTAEGGIGRY